MFLLKSDTRIPKFRDIMFLTIEAFLNNVSDASNALLRATIIII